LKLLKKQALSGASNSAARMSPVIDLSAAKGYPTLLFAPHFYMTQLEMI